MYLDHVKIHIAIQICDIKYFLSFYSNELLVISRALEVRTKIAEIIARPAQKGLDLGAGNSVHFTG